MTDLSRRQWLASLPVVAGAGGLLTGTVQTAEVSAQPVNLAPFGYCFNTSTIQGQKQPITKVVEIAAKAGYQGIEPWVRELDAHARSGGSLKDLGKQIADQGLSVEDAIGFFEWAVDDEATRRKGLEEAKRNMDMVLQIGGRRIAAPPFGTTDRSDLDLKRLTERYRTLLDIGQSIGVIPQLEVWGFSKTLGQLSEVALVAIGSGHPQACILPDVYHLHKGGSPFEGLQLLSGAAFHVFHVNDYPANPGRESITDAHRVYPGDGVAPLDSIFQTLRANGFRGMLSLELFNREYWKQDPLEVARTGLEKMKTAVQKSLG